MKWRKKMNRKMKRKFSMKRKRRKKAVGTTDEGRRREWGRAE